MPKLKTIIPGNNRGNYQFAIDFGTTNTHISYNSDLPGQTIKSFDITENDMQMVLLSEALQGDDGVLKGAGGYSESVTRFRQEFIPSYLGSNELNSFPFRTVLFESISNKDNILFSEVNIGFGFNQASMQQQDGYKSNLKWMLSREADQSSRNKLQRYFEQILWLIKNKCVLNNGNLNPTIIYMVPLSMKNSLIEVLEELWNNSLNSVFGDGHEVMLIQRTESEMPYYAIPNMLGHHSAINIDIGGGTTDIFMSYPAEQRYLASSFHFGGNDIWGDGIAPKGNFDNGFLRSVINRYEQNDQRLSPILDTINMIKANRTSLNSSDLSSLFFDHDNITELSHTIRNNGYLKVLLFIHLSAIIYKLCNLLDKQDLDNPVHLSFSGKGSKYISLITSRPKVLINTLIKVYRRQNRLPDTNVIIAENPKILTAEGALMSIGRNPLIVDDLSESFQLNDLKNVEEGSKEDFEKYLGLLQNPEIRAMLIDYDEEMIMTEDLIQNIKTKAKDSFNGVKFELNSTHNALVPIKSNIFFWWLKNTIYELTKVG